MGAPEKGPGCITSGAYRVGDMTFRFQMSVDWHGSQPRMKGSCCIRLGPSELTNM